MPNPTRQEIIRAHEAADNLAELAAHPMSYATDAEVANDYRETILAALPPKPQPTMAEVEWDDDKHYLAEAEESSLGTVVMLMKRKDGFIELTMKPYTFPLRACTLPENLTPTGKRYTLTEVQE